MKVTVVGAGKYGSTTVQRLAEKDLVDEIVMTDIVEGLPQGLALDLNQSRSLEGHETRVVGSNGYEETAGSAVCVITAGLPRKPGMSRMDLLETNAKIVAEVTRELARVLRELINATNHDGHVIHLACPLADQLAVHVVEPVVVVCFLRRRGRNQHRHEPLDVADAVATRLYGIVAQRLGDDARIDRIAVTDPAEIRVRILLSRQRIEHRALGVR